MPYRYLPGLISEASVSSSKAAGPTADQRHNVLHSKFAHASSWAMPAAAAGSDQLRILAHGHSFPGSLQALHASLSQTRGSGEPEGLHDVEHGSAKQEGAAVLLAQMQRRCSALASENKLLQVCPRHEVPTAGPAIQRQARD